MNNRRRSELANINKNLEKIYESLKKTYDDLTMVHDEEEDSFGNLSEGLQATWNGQISEEAIGNMSEAIELLDEVMEKLSDANDYIEEARA